MQKELVELINKLLFSERNPNTLVPEIGRLLCLISSNYQSLLKEIRDQSSEETDLFILLTIGLLIQIAPNDLLKSETNLQSLLKLFYNFKPEFTTIHEAISLNDKLIVGIKNSNRPNYEYFGERRKKGIRKWLIKINQEFYENKFENEKAHTYAKIFEDLLFKSIPEGFTRSNSVKLKNLIIVENRNNRDRFIANLIATYERFQRPYHLVQNRNIANAVTTELIRDLVILKYHLDILTQEGLTETETNEFKYSDEQIYSAYSRVRQ